MLTLIILLLLAGMNTGRKARRTRKKIMYGGLITGIHLHDYLKGIK